MFKGFPRGRLKVFKIGKKGKERFIKCVTKDMGCPKEDYETLDLFEVKTSRCVFCNGWPQPKCEWCLGTDRIIVLKNYNESNKK